MTKLKRRGTRITSFFLAMIMFLSVFTVGLGALMLSGEAANEGFTLRQKNWTDIAERARTLNNGWKLDASPDFITMKYKATGGTVYCVEPGVSTRSGTEYTQVEDYLASIPNVRTTDRQKYAFIGQLVQPEESGGFAPWNIGNADDFSDRLDRYAKTLAVQVLIWEVIVEERDANFNYVAPSGGADTVWSTFYARTGTGEDALAKAREYYNQFAAQVHPVIYSPSFAAPLVSVAPTHELDQYDGTYFYATLTDTNNMLQYFNFSGSGLTFEKNGNNLTIRSSNVILEENAVTVTGTTSGAYGTEGAVFWEGAGDTQVVCGAVTDPAPTAYFKIYTSVLGQIIVHKVSNDTEVTNGNSNYSLAGGQFRVTGPDGYNEVITTDSTGVAKTGKDLKMGTYAITEIKAPPGFVLDSTPKTVEVSTDLPIVDAAFVQETDYSNNPQMGVIRLQKTTTPYEECEICGQTSGELLPLENAVFNVYNWNDELVQTIVTDSTGFAQTDPLPLGTYSIEEETPASGYLINEDIPDVTLSYAGQTETISYSDTTVDEDHQHGQITIYKQDAETGSVAQGKASLNGAVFTIKDKAQVDSLGEDAPVLQTLACDEDKNYVTSDLLPVGHTYVVEEVQEPYGYQPSDLRYEVTIEPTNTNIPVIYKSTTVYNDVIRGSIEIIKSKEEIVDDTVVTKPFESVEFVVTSQTTGQVYAGDQKLTDAQGKVRFSNLPFDDYTVHEVTPEGYLPLADFTVSVEEQGHVYEHAVTNITTPFELIINKVDAESGKNIPLANTSFQLYVDVNQNEAYDEGVDTLYAWQVRQEDGTLKEESILYTSENGVAMLPEQLIASQKYLLKEIDAPEGYVLETDYIPCDVTKGDNSNQQVLIFDFPNEPQKASLTIFKIGEQLTGYTSSDTEFGTLYTPVYEFGGLPNAEFDIIAAEDIVTPDGTVRFQKDTVVASVTTGPDGSVTCPVLLYLGDYVVVETKAPYGFVLDETPYNVSLEYAGQNVAVITEEVQVVDKRQKGEIDLKKVLEEPGDDYSGPELNYEGIVFGLYAEEDLYSATGAVAIPKDSLVDVLYVAEDGTSKSSVDLPFGNYYVKELQSKDGYEMVTEVYHIEFVYQGEEVETVFIPVNNGEAIVNQLDRLDLHIDKESRGNLNVANIPFRVTGTTLSGHTYDQVFYTDENGDIDISGLLVGVYEITELECEENKYYDIPESQKVDLVTENETVSFYNEEKTGRLEILKTFEGSVDDVNANLVVGPGDESVESETEIENDESAETTLPEPQNITFTTEDGETITRYVKANVPFHIYGTSYAGYEFDEILYTDSEGRIVIEDLPIGDYTVEEMTGEWTVGYVGADTYVFTVNDDETTSEVINNEKIRAPFEFTKTDITTGEVIPDCGVRIYNERGEVVYEGRTDENGQFTIELEYGKYTYQEYDAPSGFELDETPYPFEILEDGTVVKAEMQDKPILTDITLTKLCRETEERLAGAQFAIYEKGSDEALQVVTTDSNGTATFTGLRYGDFVIKELMAPEGYSVNAEDIEVTIKEGFDRNLYYDVYDTPIPQTGIAANGTTLLIIGGAALVLSGCALAALKGKPVKRKKK